MTHQYCNAVSHQNSFLRIVSCKITVRAFLNRYISMKSLGVLMWTEGLNASKCMRFKMLTYLCGRGVSLGLVTSKTLHAGGNSSDET